MADFKCTDEGLIYYPGTLQENLKTAREMRHFRQDQVAEWGGFHRSEIAMWENGTQGRTPTEDQINTLSDIYDVPVSFLKGEKPHNETQHAFEALCSQLPE